jgi:hypothetical protein
MSIPSDCPKCNQLIVHEIFEPFASCGCGTSEWSQEAMTLSMKHQEKMLKFFLKTETGIRNLLNVLQSKTHAVKYCKTFELPALNEYVEKQPFSEMRWFEHVVTGIQYQVLSVQEVENMFDLPDGSMLYLGDLLPSQPTDEICYRILQVKFDSPSAYDYQIYLPVNIFEFSDKSKFDLGVMFENKLKRFSAKAIVRIDRKTKQCTSYKDIGYVKV